MNRSILIVICDFLLLSLLTFSTDINKMADEKSEPATKVVIATNNVVNPPNDLAAVMKQALEEERRTQEQLQQQLASAKATASQQQQEMGATAQENQKLQQQLAANQANLQNLNQQLQQSSTQFQQTQQKLAATQAEAQRQAQLASSLQQQISVLSQSNQMSQAERQELEHKLQMAEVEKKAAAQQVAFMQQQVQAERMQNERLAEGLKTLATNSTALTQEIRENRPLAPNTIYNDFLANRVQAGITALHNGFLGGNKDRRTQTVLVTDGTNIFALCHVQDTPLTLWNPGTDWDGLVGTLTHQSSETPILSLAFNNLDPRVVMIPVSKADADKLGGKVYRIVADPYKFQDAVLVNANGNYYKTFNFTIDASTPQYIKLDSSFLKGLVNPPRGDLVLSRTGELIGIMVNGTYCLVLNHFSTAATIHFGENVHGQHTGQTLAKLYDALYQMPIRLQ